MSRVWCFCEERAETPAPTWSETLALARAETPASPASSGKNFSPDASSGDRAETPRRLRTSPETPALARAETPASPASTVQDFSQMPSPEHGRRL